MTNIFSRDPAAFSNAVRVVNGLGASAADAAAAFRAFGDACRRLQALEAIERVEAKGNPRLTVQALRQHLAEVMPGAVAYLAARRGVTPYSYLAAVERGEVPTAEALALLRARYVTPPTVPAARPAE